MSGWDGFIEGAESMRPHVQNAHLSQLSAQYNRLSADLVAWQEHVNNLAGQVNEKHGMYTGLASVDRSMHCESASLEENAKAKIIKMCALMCQQSFQHFTRTRDAQNRITIDMIREYNLKAILAFFLAHREVLSSHNRVLFSRHLMQANGIDIEQIKSLDPESLINKSSRVLNVTSRLFSVNDDGCIEEAAVYANKLGESLLESTKLNTLRYLANQGFSDGFYSKDSQIWPNVRVIQEIASTFNFFKNIEPQDMAGFKGVYPIADIGVDANNCNFFNYETGMLKPNDDNFFQAVMSHMLMHIGSDGCVKMPQGSEYRMLMRKV
ncbi:MULTISPECIES: hypothetical protein [Aeromonas]|uniref:Uncharacterized protein n=1 Tax=Aeromonas veronii TaxID=654 RepID=A0A4S5CHI8_AERVE|nr:MULTISPECIES: hypothetical protein [Aeromonas]THJ43705.1 hypothetical protein E8Q35_15485 [Aeromonas veronii]